MARVIGIGGIFVKARDPQALRAWYAQHLGVQMDDYGSVIFTEDEQRPGFTLWSPFAHDTKYFDPSDRGFMLNFRVDDLDTLLANLRSTGAQVDVRIEEYDYGRFGWVMDPEGTRIELWQPPAIKPGQGDK